MFKGITKIFGDELADPIFWLALRAKRRYLEITSIIHVHEDKYYWQICIGDFCKEVRISDELAQSIKNRLDVKLHQVCGLYFKIRKQRKEKYYLMFKSQLSW